ncbi:MAG: FAD-dependent oxidoreductase [Bacteroidota bacterium]
MVSLWEKQSFLSYDRIIIGAGITGLSTAASLKEEHPNLSVAVLERGILPSGASTKNAGFACFGSVSELLADNRTLGEKRMISLVRKRVEGLALMRKRLGDVKIDFKQKGGYELIFENEDPALVALEEVNALLKEIFQEPVFSLADHKIAEFGLAKTKHLIFNQFEGQIDTGKMMSALWDHCSALGVKILTGCEVLSINEVESAIDLVCREVNFQAKRVAICCNAFSNQFFPELFDLKPGRGLVLSVVPQKPLGLAGTFHYDEGYYYFRDYNGKLLFGGGRNFDQQTEQTVEFGVNEEIMRKLLTDLEEIILPDQAYEVEQIWSGIMAFGEYKSPILKKISDRVAVGIRLGGMGVAIGSLVGAELAMMLSD